MQDFKQRGRPKKQAPVFAVEVAEPVEPVAQPVIKNVSKRLFEVYSAVLKPGETYTPTAEDKEDVRNSKRISNAVAMGHLEWV